MAAYVDEAIWYWQGLRWCHLLADDLDELHGFAARLGIHRHSYQGPPKTAVPHYDITGFERRRALKLGAVACNRAEIVAVLRRMRRNYGASEPPGVSRDFSTTPKTRSDQETRALRD